MNSDLISICIPTYNGELYLKQCLDSCIEQTYDNYEIIISDDASTDATISILNAYVAKSNKIKLFTRVKNSGLVANWNNCLKNSSGKWIKFVFQDDYITKDCLKEFVSVIKSDSKLIVSKRNFIFDYEASPEEKNHFASKNIPLENVISNSENKVNAQQISKLAVRNICVNFIAEPSLTLFKKELLNEIGYFDADLIQICDLEFFQRLATTYGLTYLPIQNCFFRLHAQSATNANRDHKSFTVTYLEPLILANKMKEDDSYASFRSGLNIFENLRLNFYINSRLLELRKALNQQPENEIVYSEYCKTHPWLKDPVKNKWFYNLVLNLVFAKRKLN